MGRQWISRVWPLGLALSAGFAGCAGTGQNLGLTTGAAPVAQTLTGWRGPVKDPGPAAASTSADPAAATNSTDAQAANRQTAAPTAATANRVSDRVTKYFPMFNRDGQDAQMQSGLVHPASRDVWADSMRARSRTAGEIQVARRVRETPADADSESSVLPVALEISSSNEGLVPQFTPQARMVAANRASARPMRRSPSQPAMDAAPADAAPAGLNSAAPDSSTAQPAVDPLNAPIFPTDGSASLPMDSAVQLVSMPPGAGAGQADPGVVVAGGPTYGDATQTHDPGGNSRMVYLTSATGAETGVTDDDAVEPPPAPRTVNGARPPMVAQAPASTFGAAAPPPPPIQDTTAGRTSTPPPPSVSSVPTAVPGAPTAPPTPSPTPPDNMLTPMPAGSYPAGTTTPPASNPYPVSSSSSAAGQTTSQSTPTSQMFSTQGVAQQPAYSYPTTQYSYPTYSYASPQTPYAAPQQPWVAPPPKMVPVAMPSYQSVPVVLAAPQQTYASPQSMPTKSCPVMQPPTKAPPKAMPSAQAPMKAMPSAQSAGGGHCGNSFGASGPGQRCGGLAGSGQSTGFFDRIANCNLRAKFGNFFRNLAPARGAGAAGGGLCNSPAAQAAAVGTYDYTCPQYSYPPAQYAYPTNQAAYWPQALPNVAPMPGSVPAMAPQPGMVQVATTMPPQQSPMMPPQPVPTMPPAAMAPPVAPQAGPIPTVATADRPGQGYVYQVAYVPAPEEWVRAYQMGYVKPGSPAPNAAMPTPPQPAAGYYIPQPPMQFVPPQPMPGYIPSQPQPPQPQMPQAPEYIEPRPRDEAAAAPSQPQRRESLLSRLFGRPAVEPKRDGRPAADCGCNGSPVAAMPATMPMYVYPYPNPYANPNPGMIPAGAFVRMPVDAMSAGAVPGNFQQGGDGINRVAAQRVDEAPQR